ncbi:MAG: hypothetical protein K0S32_1020 [Bacteroidetes bacterium]|jgi:hypothetical protein|nr:hypothetical protein [Bacteroidota bacterium]
MNSSFIKILFFISVFSFAKLNAQTKVKVVMGDKDTLFTFDKNIRITASKKTKLFLTRLDTAVNLRYETGKKFCELNCRKDLFGKELTRIIVNRSGKVCIFVVDTDGGFGGGTAKLEKKK